MAEIASSFDAAAPAVPVGEASADEAPATWPTWQLVAFRYALLHAGIYLFPSPFSDLLEIPLLVARALDLDVEKAPWSWMTALSSGVSMAWEWLTSQMAAWGVAPYEVIHQQTGSGDTGAAWAQLLFTVVISLVGAVAWSVFGRGRAYPRLGRWFHLVIRVQLAFVLLGYGLMKFYGGQFGELSLFRLTQEVGDLRPMTMVGTFMKASRPYELLGGAAEVVGALLLFHRRTVLLGAAISVGTLLNVCALNWLCGVPVKLFSAYLLLFGMGLFVPFAPPLLDLFVHGRASRAPVDLRVVKGERAGRVLLGLGIAWVGLYLVSSHVTGMQRVRQSAANGHTALYGLWTVEAMSLDGNEVPNTDASRWRDFAVDHWNEAWARELSGKRLDFEFKWDEASGRAQVKETKAAGEADAWAAELGKKVVKGEPALLLRSEERGKLVDVERRSLVLRGKWRGRELELRAVERGFRLQTGFRLRQELPDSW